MEKLNLQKETFRRISQNSSKSFAPGKRHAIPTMAMGSVWAPRDAVICAVSFMEDIHKYWKETCSKFSSHFHWGRISPVQRCTVLPSTPKLAAKCKDASCFQPVLLLRIICVFSLSIICIFLPARIVHEAETLRFEPTPPGTYLQTGQSWAVLRRFCGKNMYKSSCVAYGTVRSLREILSSRFETPFNHAKRIAVLVSQLYKSILCR